MVSQVRVTVELLCDVHRGLSPDEPSVPAEISKIYLNAAGKPRQLDWCPEHYASTTVAQLEDFVERFGTIPEPKQRRNSPHPVPKREVPRRPRAVEPERPCPVPGCPKVARTGGGLAAHLVKHTPAEQRKARAELARTAKTFQRVAPAATAAQG